MTAHPVLVLPYHQAGGDVLVVHLPPVGFVPPPPDTWARLVGLSTACGIPCGAGLGANDGLAGYGERDVVEQAERAGVPVAWCRRCYPAGAP